MTHKEIQREIQLLNSVIKQAKESLANAPEGKLIISKCRGKTVYRLESERGMEEKRKYIGVKDSDLVQQLIQKDYCQRILKICEPQKKILEKFEKEYVPNPCTKILEQLNSQRIALIIPFVQTIAMKVTKWQTVVYKGKDFSDSSVMFYTRNGERVRSKSEVIIADTFDKYNVPYRYEFPVILKGYGTVYPDFSVINPRTGREFIFEHFGMIGDAEYEKNMNRKLEMYNSCGYFYGENFLYTFETKNYPLNTVLLDSLVKHFLT